MARLVEVQDILGLDERDFAEFLVREAQEMAPDLFTGPLRRGRRRKPGHPLSAPAATITTEEPTPELRWSRRGRLQQAWLITERTGAAIIPRRNGAMCRVKPAEDAPPPHFIGAFGE